ncbi:hypothetical protein ARMGADRAFT_1016497 [Armillaria gallica]|uniref:Uncharacterized protein n=1 Tax=Armillaria gallica TaxID=47427 RepID=A0A2H3DEX1_ARMGA|nr:hypothetical protein ARMGADRAFT_1016497 [Armillaria gallica]
MTSNVQEFGSKIILIRDVNLTAACQVSGDCVFHPSNALPFRFRIRRQGRQLTEDEYYGILDPPRPLFCYGI